MYEQVVSPVAKSMISRPRRALGLAIAALATALLVAACSSSKDCNAAAAAPSSCSTNVPAPTTTGVGVSGVFTLAVGQSTQYNAIASLSDGTTQNVTPMAAWSSSNTAVATVSAGGVVTAVGAGNATVRASYQGFASSPTVTVSAPACTVSVSPISLGVVASGGTLNITVTAASSCRWSAASDSTFVTIASGASGTGNATVILNVAANAGTARTGTVTIGGQTVTVNQGANPALPVIFVLGTNATRGWSSINVSVDGVSIGTLTKPLAQTVPTCQAVSGQQLLVQVPPGNHVVAGTSDAGYKWNFSVSVPANADGFACWTARLNCPNDDCSVVPSGGSTGSLQQPACTANGTNTINVPVTNKTIYTVQLTFSGPSTKSGTLAPGATQTFVLTPGTYSLTGQVSGNATFVPSTWNVTTGCNYPLQIVSQ